MSQADCGISLASALGSAALAAIFLYKWANRPVKSELFTWNKDVLEDQSLVLEDGSRVTRPFQHLSSTERLLDEAFGAEVETMLDLFHLGLKKSRKENCVGRCCTSDDGTLYYKWETYGEFYESARQLGSALKSFGIERQQFVGIYSRNRPEWIKSELACHQFALVPVPLYDTLGADATAFIVNKTELTLIICETNAHVKKLLDQISKLTTLKTLIVIESPAAENVEKAAASSVKLLSFDEMLEIGGRNLKEIEPPLKDDRAVICFTSGTTGLPKGVDLKHFSIACNIAQVDILLKDIITEDDRYLSYLPLPHMYERNCEYYMFLKGASVGVSRGDVKLLLEDAQTLKPTFFPMVPRLLNRVHDKIEAGVRNSKVKSWLLHKGIQKKAELLQQGIISRSTLWDKLIFGKVQKLLGGCVKLVTCAAAPVNPTVLQFARCAFGCIVVEAYGQTEATAPMTFQLPGDVVHGSVGSPMACYKIKLIDVPEMNYYVKDGYGEVCGYGPNNCQGYYKEPEKTAELFGDDGWLRTGDIGTWMPNGTLRIVDRRKHIFKLAQGEYIAPERVEAAYTCCELVAQCFVEGDSTKTCTVAIVIPDPDVFLDWCKSIGHIGSIEQLCESKAVVKEVLEILWKCGKEMKLSNLEQVKAIKLQSEMFSVDNGLLTPTLKSKRPQLRQRFADDVRRLYEDLGQ